MFIVCQGKHNIRALIRTAFETLPLLVKAVRFARTSSQRNVWFSSIVVAQIDSLDKLDFNQFMLNCTVKHLSLTEICTNLRLTGKKPER